MARAPKTIVNQGAASPVALLEAFRLVVAAYGNGDPATWGDATALLGAEGWFRLRKEKYESWRNAWEDLRSPELRREISACPLALGLQGSVESTESAYWNASLEVTSTFNKTRLAQVTEERSRKIIERVVEATADLEQLLQKDTAAPIVLTELLDIGAIEKDEKERLVPAEAWLVRSQDLSAAWFFERLARHFLRRVDQDLDYRLLGAAYRWWMEQVKPDPQTQELECLRGRMSSDDFVSFNQEHGERLGGLVMTQDGKIGPWVTAICQLGMAWIPLPLHKAKAEEFGRPFPEPSRLLAWGLNEVLPAGKELPFDEFVAAIGARYPVLDYSGSKVLPFGLSFALRAMHDDGIIELTPVKDAKTMTRLAEDPVHRVKIVNRVRRVP